MNKSTKNADTVVCKLRLALTRATHHRLEVASKEGRKKKPMVERKKTEAMNAKRQRARGGISLSSLNEENYESYTGDKIDSNQADDKYSLQI